MHGARDRFVHERQYRLKVWGGVSDSVERLIVDLTGHGWSAQRCGWPHAGHGDRPERGCAHLMALDGPSATQLAELQPLLEASDADWVFVCPSRDIERGEVRAMLARYAFAYHCLPGDAAHLDTLLHAARSMAVLSGNAARPRHAGIEESGEDMVGSGPAMRGLFSAIRKVAAVDAPVLIRGESGSGKELTARAIHERSARAGGPFVAVNCAALPPELVQSELFGHEKGAFTGADGRHVGHVETAAGGTLLLDEIGDLPLALQVHLLRFLQSGTIQRVGGTAEIPVDMRVVAATHVPLEQAVADGRFREDLYHRVDVVSLRVPPLRERTEDIEALGQYFYQRFAGERGASIRGISQSALLRMCQHDWPGNVRELINRMRRAVVLGEGEMITAADLGLEDVRSVREPMTLEAARERAEREQIQVALARNRHCITAAARELNISRVTLYRLIDRHQLGTHKRHSRECTRAISHSSVD